MSAGKLRAHVLRVARAGAMLAAAAAAHAQVPDAVPLREGATRTVGAERAADRYTYAIDVDEPGNYLLRIEQRGLDLVVSLQMPTGSAASYNSPLLRDGSELVLLAGGAGRYRVEVFSEEHTGAAGGHAATLTRLAPGTDVRELEAWRLMTTGAAANFASGDQGWAGAVDAYERAATLWHDLGRAREEADAALAVATVRYRQLFEWQPAVEYSARAAALYDSLGEAALAANARRRQGQSLVELALEETQSATDTAVSPKTEAIFARALDLLEQARAVHERLGDVCDLGLVVNDVGYTYYSKGELERARSYYENAAALLGGVEEWGAQVRPLSNLAVLDAEAGRLVSAVATFERILELLPPTQPNDRSLALDNLGATQRMLGRLDEALQTLAAALDLQRKLDDEQSIGRSLRRIGETYYGLGELDLAKEYLEQALPIAVRTNDGRSQEAALRNLGNVAFLERDYEAALARHREALEITASSSDRAHLQLLVAKDLVALGRAADAAAAAAAAKAFADETHSEVLVAGALNALGRALVLSGDAARATENLERAAGIYERLDLRSEHAEALHGLSLAARAAHQTDRALEHGAAALREVETLRARVADPELRASFAAARREYYETQIELLMTPVARPGTATPERALAALAVSEGGRARMIADLLQEASVDLRGDFDPALRAKQTGLVEQLAERRHQRDLLLEQPPATRDAAELVRVLADLASLENALNLLEIDARRGNPRFARLTAPEPLTPAEMQASLDADTVVLQYSLGASASYVWAVTKDRVAAFELADRATIEAAARRALAGLERYTPGGTRGAADDASTRAVATAPSGDLAALAALVLEPVAAELAKPRVVLALDGALQYVPFGVLPLGGRNGAAPAPLLATHEVVEIPSLSALALSVRETARTPRKTLAVFADPVLQPSDPRLGGKAPAAELASAPAPRSSSGAALGRLLSTGYEAEAIARLVPDDRRLLASGFAANREAVLGNILGDFRYIHFATHGLVDSRYPGLSALVLSQFDDRGRPQDGYLRLKDIYDLKLNADLVVLSACDTALGREVRGEGLIGLTQGFMAAGARSLVASLWQVPDRATAELMTRFYGNMLNDGLRPADALRKAQQWSAAQPRYRDPYFWGGFVLVGDWR